MTTQGEDLLAWLDRAITEREEVARRATQTPWRNHDTHLDLGGHTATVLTGEWNDTELLAWFPTMSHQPWDETRNAWNNAEHAAVNDPESVLRRCAADRKLLALHNTPGVVFPDGAYLDDNRWCVGCGYGNDGEPLTADVNDCPTLCALAEGYGWTEGER